MNEQIEIGIIGGTGVYDPGLLKDAKQIKVYTPFGATSDLITVGEYAGRKVAFLPRHGTHHHIPPHHVPYRANLWAFSQLGIKRVISPRAVGSLREDMAPGDMVISDQFIDFTKKRECTFYDGGEVGHIAMGRPFCSELREIAMQVGKKVSAKVHNKGTSICIEGPRYSTHAESVYFRDACKADIIGMTLIPEYPLARELEMCFLSIDAVTDYDAWSDEIVDTTKVKETMTKNIQTIRDMLIEIIPQIPIDRDSCECPHALEDAMI